METLLLLSFEFFSTGLFSVGGGMATIPFLQAMGRRHPGWFSSAKLADMIAASQCAPGPLGTNMAVYAGYTVAGLPGCILAVLSLMAPTIAVDLLVARLMERFRSAAWIERLMRVLRPVSAGLILAAAVSLLADPLTSGKAFSPEAPLAFLNLKSAALFAVLLPTLFLKRLKKLHPFIWIAAGALVGWVFKF
ncbi:MAG: chromate transporter [Oscillospiraceae bacterium]|jgi:chromate transporter|nr:chromate transporter [Oscillospiraceae bacterium]